MSELYPYAKEFFFLDIFDALNFFILMYSALVHSVWFIYFLGIYGFHGALWDYCGILKTPENNEARLILTAWFWNAIILVLTSVFSFLTFILLKKWTLDYVAIGFTLTAWAAWRIFFDWRVKCEIRKYRNNVAMKRKNLSKIIIRNIREEDFNEVANMRHQLWEIHGINSIYIDCDFLQELDAYEDLKRAIKDEKLIVLVIEVDGKLIGYSFLEERAAEDFFKFKKCLYLDEMFLKKEYRGVGIGGKMLKYIKEIAINKRYPVIISRIYPFSKAMRSLFEREGGEELYGTFILPLLPFRKNK
jgi:GNAT superfamily N-acetyltransferase